MTIGPRPTTQLTAEWIFISETECLDHRRVTEKTKKLVFKEKIIKKV